MGSRVDFANYGRTVGVDFSVVYEYITLVYTLFNNVIENRQTTKKLIQLLDRFGLLTIMDIDDKYKLL